MVNFGTGKNRKNDRFFDNVSFSLCVGIISGKRDSGGRPRNTFWIPCAAVKRKKKESALIFIDAVVFVTVFSTD